MGSIKIVYPEFPTHAPYTNNKIAPDKYIKINGQTIYNGKLNRFSRNNVMTFMHNYLIDGLPEEINIEFPITVELWFYAPVNYSTVRRLKGEVRWKVPTEDYKPNWDMDNQEIWGKAFRDALQLGNRIPNDTVAYIINNTYRYKQIEDFNKRKLEFYLIN